MSSRISPVFARTAVVALLFLGVVAAQATAQQVQQAEPVPAPVSAPATVTTAQSAESGPRVRPEMPRAQANFRVVSRSSMYRTDHTTTIRISTIILILAVVVLVLVLI